MAKIDEKIRETGLSERNKKNSSWKKFKNLIVHTDTRLEEKFEFSLNHFCDEISALKSRLLKKNNVPDDVDLASEYADYRNHLAHGDIVDMSDTNVVNFCLMRVLIYCLILERADISKDARKL